MKKLLLLALGALFALHAAALSTPMLCVGKESIRGDSGNWVSDTYAFSVASGSAIAVRGTTSWSLFLDNAFVAETYGAVDSFHCIRFVGTGSEDLHIYLTGQNALVYGGIHAEKCGMLSIHGPGSLSETVTKKSAQAISSSGDLWIGEGAVLSVVELPESGVRSSYNAIGANGGISIVNSSVSVVHSGGVLGYGSIGCGGTYLSIIGSVVAVCADVPSEKGAIRVPGGELLVSCSSVTVLANAPAFVANTVKIDMSAFGLASVCTGISSPNLVVENAIGLVVADGNAVETANAEFRSGNDLSIIGNARKEDEWNAAIRLVERNGRLVHLGGKTRLFAPNGTAFLGDGDNWSSHIGCADFDMRGGTLQVSADPDWSDVRDFFTVSTVAATAESVLQGAVSGDTSLSLLQNFFADEMVVSWLSELVAAGSSVKPVRGLSARHLAFKGGMVDVQCRTDANGILSSGSAAVSGGKVFVNGRVWGGPAATVTFNANGGTVSTKSRNVSRGAQLGALPMPTRKGCVFTGWWTQKSGGALVSAASKVSGSMTLYAHWANKSYKVQFVANGGKGKMSAQKMTYGKAAKLNANKFRRPGYVFLGWAKKKNGAVAFTNKKAVKNLTATGGTVKLYAKWGRKVAVNFIANGGKLKKKSQAAITGKRLGTLPVPTRKNWNFDGWWTKRTGGKRITASTTVSKSMTLYARWSPIVTIVFDPNGGTLSGPKSRKTRTYPSSANKGTWYLDTSGFPYAHRPGFDDSFSWYTKKAGGTPYWNLHVSKPCSVKLYAHWDSVYEPCVCFSWWDGETWQWQYEYFAYGKRLGSLPEPWREGFEFAGWFTGEDGTGRRITSSTIANESLPEDVYAYWKPLPSIVIDFVKGADWLDSRSYLLNQPLGWLPELPSGCSYWAYCTDSEKHVYVQVTESTIADGSFSSLRAIIPNAPAPPLSPTGLQ